ncbi:MAG: hypothetical protein JNM84_28285 [Planctomycetes bacterium]|nr:hypothetical protein [Planctomycetota bacterium]
MIRSLLCFALLCATVAAQHPPELALPPRGGSALTGSAFPPLLQGLAVAERERLLWHELAAGNVPDHLRVLVPVTTSAVIQGRTRTARFYVTPDYVGVGRTGDWFRVPLTPHLAQQLADRLECALPTRRMVDAIWAAAPLKLQPFPYSPSVYNILSVALFHQHHLQIESQRAGAPPERLTAGIKKDVVASALIASSPGRVCIYGWHYPSGAPIQPLSRVHESTYADYSHGIRLVARRMEVDGVSTTVEAVLQDPLLHPLLSDEGAIPSSRYPASSYESFPWNDRFPSPGPELASWRAKFTAPISVATQPAPPSGDATALRIQDPAGGTESLRLEPGFVRDVVFEADLLCDHRPEVAASGYERMGIFVRDRASGAFDGTSSQQGACYALCFDSNDGRVRCLRVSGGVLIDLLPSPRYAPATAWRRFRLEAEGTRLRFALDGELLLEVVDATHSEGAFGIGYHEYFSSNALMRGTRVDAVHAEVPNAFALELRSGLSPGSLELRRRRGSPGDFYLTVFTFQPGAFPNGWFYGLDPAPAELAFQLSALHPIFVGRLDARGESELLVPGLPAGLSMQAVALTLDPSLRLLRAARPVALVLP